MRLTKKQKEVVATIKKEQPKITILYGGKRGGKTFLAILLFLSHVANFENQDLSFIIAGVNYSALERNVFNEMEDLLGITIKLNKSGAFRLFGNTIYCFDGALASSWKKVRGFTSAGALINEATGLHDSFIKEVISRCSHKGARVLIDTNPENPAHSIKTDYIDKSGYKLKSGRTNILAFHFTLFDNETLDPEYVESIVQATPSGSFTDRDIHGRWVARQGAVYSDFSSDRNSYHRSDTEGMTFDRIVVGVDWGYEHYGVMLVVGVKGEDYYLLEEHAHQHRTIEYWSGLANTINERYTTEYGRIHFYCDGARPEYVARLQDEGLHAIGAFKSILPGVSLVASLFKTEHIFVPPSDQDFERFHQEVNNYIWDTKQDMPKKGDDDVMDALRYAIYTDYQMMLSGEVEEDEQIEALKKLGLS